MIRDPAGIRPPTKKPNTKRLKSLSTSSFKNRGMTLEADINISNEYYLHHHQALIYKRPTPINVVKVNYTRGAMITQAYFEKQSTTDYNGIYRGRYVDFEAKSTQSRSSFPIANITKHQIDHLKSVIALGGIAFFILYFASIDEAYMIKASDLLKFIATQSRQSLPYQWVKKTGSMITFQLQPRLDYLPMIDQLFF
jgi:recombination protein U